MSKNKVEANFSEDIEVIEFTQTVPIVYLLSRVLREGIDTIIVEGSVDLSPFSEKTKKVTVCNITLPIQDAIKFCDEVKNYCLTSTPPEPPQATSGLSDGNKVPDDDGDDENR